MPTSTMTSKGQITIPKEVRDRLGIAPGDRLDFVVGPDGTVSLVSLSRPVRELFGLLKTPGRAPVPIEAMDESVVAAVAVDNERIRKGK